MSLNGSWKKRNGREQKIKDDDFSRDLKEQGKDGRLMRMLYLRHPMYSYMKRIADEPIQY